MSTSLAQPSFASGEIAPALYGRTDLSRYLTGLKKCSNFFVIPYGGARNRPGTRFIAQTKNNAVARMITFKFSTTDTYALEFTAGVMRVYRNGGLVLTGANVPFELVHPFTQDELFDIRFTQSADVMILTHVNHKPQKLTRLGHANWTIADIVLVPGISAPASATATATPGGSSSITQSWTYQITAVKDDGTQTVDESLPATSNTITVKSDNLNASVTWPAVSGANYYHIYKDNAGAGVFGFIGRSFGTSFTDNNIAPTKTDTPPTGSDPFVGAGNFPRAVGFYQQRLAFGGTLNKPQTLWFSKAGVLFNFGFSIPQKDDDAIVWTMASQQVNQINHLLPLKALLTLTDGAEWVIQGTSVGFTPKTINGSAETYNGIGRVRPLVINNNAIYAQERGQAVTSLSYSLDSDGFSGSDVSLLSPHLLEDYSIVDWDFQKIPNSIVWSVREDGVMLGMTYLLEQQVIAWHHHHTDGLFKSVCSVPENREDYLYLCVERQVNSSTVRYVERMESRKMYRFLGQPVIDRCFFVDCGLTYNGTNSSSETMTLTGGTDWQSPETLTLTSSNGSRFVSGDVGDIVVLSDLAAVENIRLKITAFTSGSVVSVIPIGVVPTSLRNVAVLTWGIGRDVISGLSHLEGKTVSILADGNVQPQRIVTGGSVTIPTPAVQVHVGLPYRAELATLELTVPGSETLQDKHKIINGVTVLLDESRGGFIGSDVNSMDEIKQRTDDDGYGSIPGLSGKVSVNIDDTWEGRGSITIVQDDPLPMSVLSIIPRLTVGGFE